MNISRKQIFISLAIVLVTVVVGLLIIRSPQATSVDEHGHGAHSEHGHGEAEEYKDDHEAPSEGVGSGDHAGEQVGHDDHQDARDSVVMSDAAIKAAGIDVVRVTAGTLNKELMLPGEIVFNQDRLAHVTPRFPGVAVTVFKGLGAAVRKGETLAIIESPQLAELRSQYLSALKRQELAQSVFERERKLWENKISPEQDFLTARKDLAEAQIEVEALQGQMGALGAASRSKDGLARYTLVAPQDGIVIEKHVSVGEAVREDSDLFLIVDLRTVWAEITIQPRMLGVLRAGQSVRISSSDLDAQVQGTIATIGSLIGEQTRTAKARVLVPNPEGRWRPGLFVNVVVSEGQEPETLTVPIAALQTYENSEVVFARTKEGFVARPVRVGRRDTVRVEILEGLKSGDYVAARNSFIIKADLGKSSAEHEH